MCPEVVSLGHNDIQERKIHQTLDQQDYKAIAHFVQSQTPLLLSLSMTPEVRHNLWIIPVQPDHLNATLETPLLQKINTQLSTNYTTILLLTIHYPDTYHKATHKFRQDIPGAWYTKLWRDKQTQINLRRDTNIDPTQGFSIIPIQHKSTTSDVTVKAYLQTTTNSSTHPVQTYTQTNPMTQPPDTFSWLFINNKHTDIYSQVLLIGHAPQTPPITQCVLYWSKYASQLHILRVQVSSVSTYIRTRTMPHTNQLKFRRRLTKFSFYLTTNIILSPPLPGLNNSTNTSPARNNTLTRLPVTLLPVLGVYQLYKLSTYTKNTSKKRQNNRVLPLKAADREKQPQHRKTFNFTTMPNFYKIFRSNCQSIESNQIKQPIVLFKQSKTLSKVHPGPPFERRNKKRCSLQESSTTNNVNQIDTTKQRTVCPWRKSQNHATSMYFLQEQTVQRIPTPAPLLLGTTPLEDILDPPKFLWDVLSLTIARNFEQFDEQNDNTGTAYAASHNPETLETTLTAVSALMPDMDNISFGLSCDKLSLTLDRQVQTDEILNRLMKNVSDALGINFSIATHQIIRTTAQTTSIAFPNVTISSSMNFALLVKLKVFLCCGCFSLSAALRGKIRLFCLFLEVFFV